MTKISRIVILVVVVGMASFVLSGCIFDKKDTATRVPSDSAAGQSTTLEISPSADPAVDGAAIQAVKSGTTDDAAITATTNLDATFTGLDGSIDENDLDDAALGM